MKCLRIAVCLFLLTGAGVVAAQERPPWLSDEVIAAAAAIGLTSEQMDPFRENVRVFLESYRDEARKLIRRGAAGLEGQIDRARRSLAGDMDERMAQLLSDEQMARYADYRAALLEALEPD